MSWLLNIIWCHASECLEERDLEAERDFGMTRGHVALGRGVLSDGAFWIGQVDRKITATEINDVAAAARVDHEIGHRTEIHTVNENPVIATTGDELNALDIQQCLQFNTGSEDAL